MWEIVIFTAAIPSIKGNIIDSYATAGSVRTPCAFKYDVKILIFVDIRLRVAPRGTLIIVQLPYRLGFYQSITDRLYVQS